MDGNLDLLQLCPEVVLGKYVAITSIDSGPLVPTEKEIAAGWQTRGGIGYSLRIASAEDVPRAGWDEWYIFKNLTDLGTSYLKKNSFEIPQEAGSLVVFVNYCFTPHQPEMEDLASVFWQQLERLRPETYVADNDYLSFVTMDQELFAKVRDAANALDRT